MENKIEKSIRKSRRFGRFSMSWDLLNVEKPELLLAVMSHFIVTKCEHNFAEGTFEYQAWSPLFESLPEAVVMPEYRIMITQEQDNAGNEFVKSVTASKFVVKNY